MFIPDEDNAANTTPLENADSPENRLATFDNELAESVTKNADARNRSFRTFTQGLLVVVLTTMATLICDQAGAIEWTTKYWAVFGGAAGTAVLTAIASYVMRYVDPPK